eukprot:3381611-Rhodomonas_salina.2
MSGTDLGYAATRRIARSEICSRGKGQRVFPYTSMRISSVSSRMGPSVSLHAPSEPYLPARLNGTFARVSFPVRVSGSLRQY